MNDEMVQRKLAAIFHADVAGYTRLMRDDEVATVGTLSRYRELMINLIRQHRGRVVDTSGDNVLAEFPSVVDAMQSAVSIQKELGARNASLPEHRRMQFRIGINIGDVIQEGDRIYGDGVNIAARLEGLAEPGGICISRTAYDQLESKLPFGYEYLGERRVKNINKPLHAYRVIIDPERESRQKGHPEEEEFENRRRHARHEFSRERSEQPFHRVKGRLKKFAQEMREDEQLGETFEDIKGRFRTFADDVSDSPERRRRAFHNMIQNKHWRLFLGIAAGLFLINALASFGRWWFQTPLAAVGLAVYLHWLRGSLFSPERMNQMRRKFLQQELARMDAEFADSAEGKKRAEKQVNERIHFYKHLYIYIGVNAFLILINLLTSPFHWWFQFPLLGWGIGLFFHWMRLRT